MEHIHEAIEIDAAPEQVWQVLVDFERYPDWNPLIVKLEGVPALEAELVEWVEVSKAKRMRFKTRILELVPSEKLAWQGVYAASWLFSGYHQFILEPLAAGTKTKFIQKETFSGWLMPFMNMQESAQGYRRMNEALKQRVENADASTPA